VETWDDIPAHLKDANGLWVNDYGGYMAIGYDSAKVPAPTSVADLLKPDYKGKVALNGDPTQAGAAFAGVQMVSIAKGGTADDIAKGVTSSSSSRRRATSCPSTRHGHHRVRAPPRSSSTGTTSTLLRRPMPTWKVMVPKESVIAGYYFQAINADARTRLPHACGRSSSTPTRARTSGSRVALAPFAVTRWPRPARSTRSSGTHSRPSRASR
jgi:putative spermidine/putrescine transport system substrate-binding protein